MREKGIRIIPERSEEFVKKVNCDLCSKEIEESWGDGDFKQVIVQKKVGYRYAYHCGGESTTTSYDICVECFDSVLVPVLDSRGVQPSHEELDW